LDCTIEIGLLNELSDRDNSQLSNKATASKEEVHSISKGKKTFSKEKSTPDIHNCKNCGGDRAPKQKSCPVFGRKCLHCGKPNHFEKVCHSKLAGRQPSTRRGSNSQWSNRRHHVNEISPEFPVKQEEDDLFVIDAITKSSKSWAKREIYCTVEIHGKQVELKIDQALNATLSHRIYSKDFVVVKKSTSQEGYNWLPMVEKHNFTTLGTVNFNCYLRSMCHNLEFHVVDKPVTPLLGGMDSLSLNLIQLHS